MLEADFATQFVDLCNTTGWGHNHTRRSIGKGRRWTTATSVKGWPDYFLWHPAGDFLFAEIKGDGGELSPDQERVIPWLRSAGLEVRVWWPSDHAEMDARLKIHMPGVTSRLERVACDGDCGALVDPRTHAECRAAVEHWRDHSLSDSFDGGCSHGR